MWGPSLSLVSSASLPLWGHQVPPSALGTISPWVTVSSFKATQMLQNCLGYKVNSRIVYDPEKQCLKRPKCSWAWCHTPGIWILWETAGLFQIQGQPSLYSKFQDSQGHGNTVSKQTNTVCCVCVLNMLGKAHLKSKHIQKFIYYTPRTFLSWKKHRNLKKNKKQIPGPFWRKAEGTWLQRVPSARTILCVTVVAVMGSYIWDKITNRLNECSRVWTGLVKPG